ncbi:MAG: glycoside hydrolase family 16 protein [Pyrinomonadaceae bacterium]|nr:glycoside hydrolase family 16 protein [Pyrinomonadaceae bacterium]
MEAKEIIFSGLKWKIRNDGQGSPGNNFWRQDNVWLDKKGFLHLKIRKVEDVWTCAELQTVEKFLYGKFEFEIIGRIDEFDKNIVLGLFKYPNEAEKDGLGEIDIEFAKWSDEKKGSGNFTVWSDVKGVAEKTNNFKFSLQGTHTTHAFTRTPESVYFQSFHGHTLNNKIYEWNYSGNNISKTPMPIYLNFWLFRGMPPSDLQEYEIIIKSVKFEKLS